MQPEPALYPGGGLLTFRGVADAIIRGMSDTAYARTPDHLGPGAAPAAVGQSPEGAKLAAIVKIMGARRVVASQLLEGVFEPGSSEHKSLLKAIKNLSRVAGSDGDSEAEDLDPALKKFYEAEVAGPKAPPPAQPGPPGGMPPGAPGAQPLGPGAQLGGMAPQ